MNFVAKKILGSFVAVNSILRAMFLVLNSVVVAIMKPIKVISYYYIILNLVGIFTTET